MAANFEIIRAVEAGDKRIDEAPIFPPGHTLHFKEMRREIPFAGNGQPKGGVDLRF